MKQKIHFLFMLLLMLVVGVGNAGADTSTSTLTFNAACNGSGTADDGAQWTVTSDGTESNFDSTSGIHYGTKNASVTYLQLATSDISGTITQVVVNARDAQAKATISVTVGGSAFTCSGSATATNTSADYTFTGNGNGEIVVKVDRGESQTKAIYVKSVAVTYQTASSEDGTKTDIITNNDYSNTTYSDFTISGKPSGAEYKGNATKANDKTYMQFRGSSNSGLVVSKSAGKVKVINLRWNSTTADGRTLDIYGKNTAYTAVSDLYDSNKQGTKIGSLTYNSGNYDVSFTIPDDYKYIGIRSSNNALYLTSIQFVWEEIPAVTVEAPTFSIEGSTYIGDQSVELTCETDGATIYYTLDGSDPTSESTQYTDPITISETTTLKAIAIKGEDASAIATAEYKIVVTEGKGTEENPFTVADARNILMEGLAPTGVYVTGIVSGIVDAYNSQYGNISYNISDDGTTESDQLQAYRGKGKNGADFTSDADIQVKDVVVLKGNLIDYNGTYELAAGNQLVSLVRPEKAEPNLTYANAAVSAVRGEAFTAPVLTNPNNLTVVYTSSDKTVATVDSESGEVTLLKAGETTITASFAGNADYKAGEASYTLTVTVPSHFATFFVNGQQGEPVTVAEDETITFPTVVEELYGKKFVGWTTEAIGETGDEPATLVNAATMGNADVTYYAVFANVTAGTATNTDDNLTREWTEVEEKATYVEWSGKKATSDAVYAGQSAGDKNSIQLRSSNSNSGVVSTTSGGKLKKVVVDWNGETADGRTLNVYGSNTAYTAATELYGNDAVGTLLGTIVKGTSTELAIDGDYAYVGLRSASGAMYLNSISITWENGTPDTYSDYCTTVVKPVAKIGNKGFETLQAAVDAAEEDATIDIVDDFTLTTVTTSPSDKYNVNVNKSVTINGNNHVITASEGKRGILLEGEGLDVTIKDLTIKSNKAEACLWIASNLTCTLDNTVLDGTNGKSYNQPLTIGSIDAEGRVKLNVTNGSVIKTNDAGTAHYAIIAWHPADITVTGSKLIGWANVYLKPAAAGSTVKIDGSEMKSQGLSGSSNNFAIIVTEGNGNTIEVKDTKIEGAAVEGTNQSLFRLGGKDNVLKFLGSTTYETNDMTWGCVTYEPGSAEINKIYFDETTKTAFAKYFAEEGGARISETADETELYPLNYVSEVYYYWVVDGVEDGGNYDLAQPFVNGWLDNGEFIRLKKDVTLASNLTWAKENASFTMTFGDFKVTKGEYSIALKQGVTVNTDKQTDIFSAVDADNKVVETAVEGGYTYTVVAKDYVAQVDDVKYETLAEAVAAAEEGATIGILKDFTLTTVTTSPSDKYNVNVNKSVTINGNNHVITASEGKRGILLEGEGLDVTIKDLTIKSNKAEACLWIASNLTCTLDNTVLDGTNGKSYNQPLTIGSIDAEGRVKLNVTNGSVIKTNDAGTAHYSIIAWHPADITVTGSKLIGWANVYLKPAAAGSTVKIDGSEMKSQGLSGNSNNFSTITTECGNNVIEVKDTKITSAAVDGTYMSLLTLGGEGNVVKLLGETTYETNSKEWGAITFNWGSLFKNKLYLDDTTKEALAEYFDGSHQETVDPADETGLYPVSFVPEVYYYWAVESGYQGGYYSFAEPFENGWLADGEFIALQKDITLTKNIACQLGEGTSFNFLLGDYNVTKGDYSVSLNTGVTVLTDKQTDIFKAAKAGYKIVESTTEEGYSYTAQLSAPIIFHDEGTYEDALTVAMAGEGTIKYTLNGGTEQTYTKPFTIDATTTVKAWTEQDGAKSDVEEKTFTIVEKTYDGDTFDGYYTIKNNGNDMFVNVAGRKTVTFESETADKAGTVIRVKTNDKGQVEVLRSQGVDVPGYADKAMRYVPKIVQLVVDKLHAEGTGTILGENGLKKIMEKFDASFDEHLYLEEAENGYRIYGRTPSMKPVVDFYAENKANVDAKLPQLEQFINSAIQKVLEKTEGRGKSILVDFSLHEIWEKMGKTLTEPVDETSTARFYEEVLSSETNVWNFAYQTAMIYWGNLKNNGTFQTYIGKLGDYAKYINKVENIRPNFKYYIVQKDGKMDIISEGNEDIVKNNANTIWTLEDRTEFSVAFNEENVLNDKYYTTLYTDFAYTLPEGVKAYKVTKVSEAGVAVKVEMKGIIPAQTPVLLESESKENQTLILSTVDGTAPADNILVGADSLINQYQIKTAQVEDLFNFAKDILGESFYNTYIQKYEHLMLRYAGTVNNKYFFGLTEDDVDKCTELNEAGKKTCVIRSLSMGDKKLGFYNNWEAKANQAFLVTKDFNPVKLFLVGDVNRSGDVTVADVNALVEIVLGKVTEPDDTHDFDAAHVNADKDITIADVTALVNIILGK